MSTIPTLFSFTPGSIIADNEVDSNFAALHDTLNTFGLFTDVPRTVTAVITFDTSPFFNTSLTFGAGVDIGTSAGFSPQDAFFQGIVCVGTTIQTGAANGDITLGHSGVYRALNWAGGGSVRLLELDGNDNSLHIYHQNNFGAITLGLPTAMDNPIVTLGAVDSDVIIRNNRTLRSVNVLANGSLKLIGADGTDNVLIADNTTQAIGLGSPVVGATSAGDVVMRNSRSLRGVNGAGTGTVMMLSVDNGDRVVVGSASVVMIGNPASANLAAPGELLLGNLKSIRGANAAGTSTISMISLDNNDRVTLAPTSIATFGNPVSTSAAAPGDVVLATTAKIRSSNNAGNATIRLIESDAANRVVLAGGGADIKWGTPLVGLGATTLVTLGKTGGSGPAVAPQDSWMRVVDSAGAAFFVPVWK